MSYVTQVIITFPPQCLGDNCPIKLGLKKFTDGIGSMEFQELHRVGGNKNLECEFYIGSFNYFDADYFMKCLEEILAQLKEVCEYEDEWKHGQMMIKNQNDEYWNTIFVHEINKNDFR